MIKLIVFGVIVVLSSVAIMLIYMCKMASDRSGWSRLAKRHGLRGNFDGKRLRLQTGSLNYFAFHRVLNLGAGPSGLYLCPAFHLRPFHPPVVIPWGDLKGHRFADSHHAGLALEVGGVDDIELRFSEETVDRLRPLVDPSWTGAAVLLDTA
ncbi:MAG: hypothetical protein AAGD06_11030 [Acidobacteriota bacterium]